MTGIIEVRSLQKYYKQLVAVKNVSFSVTEGEFLSLLGASGCGKTTTLRMIAGLEQPTGGRVLFHGTDITHVPASQRDMRMVFQDFALFPNLSVWDNVAFGLRLRINRGKFAAEEVKKRVGQLLEIVQLSNHADQRPHQLSGGQKQRVALARALVTDPPVVLFDEPLGSLDASMRKTMQLELKRLHRELRKTFIYVTHDQEEAMGLSDRVAVLQGGEILQLAPPEQIYAFPNCEATAKFVGTANVLTGPVRGEGGQLQLQVSGGALIALGGNAASLARGATATVMIRAEKVRIRNARGDSNAGLSAKIVERLFLGEKFRYEVDLANGGPRLTAFDTGNAGRFNVGDQVSVLVDAEDVCLIGGKTGGQA